jgi:2'-5' RNA ligase
LFVALWPDDGTRARLAGVASEWSRRPIAAANMHMTLHFLGACTAEQMECYSKVLSRIDFKAFEINMDYIGTWRRARIQWLGSSEPPAALIDLVDRLEQVLASCGYQTEKRPFVPHVTLARNVKNPLVKVGLPPIRWVVREYVLAESITDERGARYLVRARWACD